MEAAHLTHWVNTQIQRGYTIAQVRDCLVQHGYPLSAVDVLLNDDVPKPSYRREKKSSSMMPFALAGVGILFIWSLILMVGVIFALTSVVPGDSPIANFDNKITGAIATLSAADGPLPQAVVDATAPGSIECNRDEECFEKAFSQCQPAHLLVNIPFAAIFDVVVLGEDENGCKMQTTMRKSTETSWNGKSMVCVVDNTNTFKDTANALVDSIKTGAPMDNCEGELFDYAYYGGPRESAPVAEEVAVQQAPVQSTPVQETPQETTIVEPSSVIDCGENKGCFEENFATCTPAKISLGMEMEGVPILEYIYQINGEVNGECRITSHYALNPSPEWENKEMTCSYNNDLEFQEASEELTRTFFSENPSGNCQGPLYELMTQ